MTNERLTIVLHGSAASEKEQLLITEIRTCEK